MPPSDEAPLVSVILEGAPEAPLLPDAVHSVLRQRLTSLELLLPAGTILSDGGDRDGRIRVCATGEDALRTARGRWIATLGANDLFHPERLIRLVQAAEEDGAGAACDGIIHVGSGGHVRSISLSDAPLWLDHPALRSPEGAQLRLIVRTEMARQVGSLSPEFTDRLFLTGCRVRFYPSLTYFRRDPRLASPVVRGAGAARRPALLVLSRQRVVGNTQGSSTYLLSLCEALGEAGFDLHYLCPSPSVFGRWPFLALQPEMRIFRSVTIRGGLRIGRFILATNPRVAIGAALGLLDRAARKFGLSLGRLAQRAPYSIAVPLEREDAAFIARHAPPKADAILADYAFLTEAIPYVLRPAAPSAVLMHDLFSGRGEQFGRVGSADSVASLDLESEMRLLSGADAVLAIQSEEAEIVQRSLPATRVIVTPMAIRPVRAPQPSGGKGILFVGSNTAPNIDGLGWFLDSVWPIVRTAEPRAVLRVAGTVVAGFPTAPEGVAFLGRVPDLAPLYSEAAVVISPLRVGSGLKIKLIEALGHGKAVVATKATLQGVEDTAGPGVIRADGAEDFARSMIQLLADEDLRARTAERALNAARNHFSAEACYGQAIAFLRSAAQGI